eukprot:5441709-Pyramimonas_sp.AAC.1
MQVPGSRGKADVSGHGAGDLGVQRAWLNGAWQWLSGRFNARGPALVGPPMVQRAVCATLHDNRPDPSASPTNASTTLGEGMTTPLACVTSCGTVVQDGRYLRAPGSPVE